MEDTVIVFGIGPAGLFVSQQLKKFKSAELIGIGKKDDIGRYSNVFSSLFLSEQPVAILSYINSIIDCRAGKKVKGLFCSDQYLTMAIEDIPQLFCLLDFCEPQEHILRLIADKVQLIQNAHSLGVNFPKEYNPVSFEGDDFTAYPVAIKPNIKRGHSSLPKIAVVNNAQEKKHYLANARDAGISPSDLIVQQYVSGSNDCEYGYGGYFRNGKPICDICFRQLRQYPQGVCCYILEVTDAKLSTKIKSQPLAFAQKLNYSGFLQFDIKIDNITSEVFSLDINPRPWGSVSALRGKCGDLTVFDGTSESKPICWRFPLKELFALGNKSNVSYKRCREIKRGKDRKSVV